MLAPLPGNTFFGTMRTPDFLASTLAMSILILISAGWAGSDSDSCESHKLQHSMYRLYEIRGKVPADGGCLTQTSQDTVQLEVAPSSMIENGFEPNYITFGGWLNIPGSDYTGIWYPLIFESRVSPDFEAVYGWVMLDIVPGLLVRMRSQYSHPIFTPSFMPSLRIYTWNRERIKRLNLEKTFDQFSYWGFSINHHSNGEVGAFYNADGTVDTVRGSFGTNLVVFEYHNWSQFNFRLPVLWKGKSYIEANDFSFSLEIHLPNPAGHAWFHDPVLDQQFGPIRPHFNAVIYQRSPVNPSSYAKGWFNFSYAFPRKYRIAPEPALGIEGKPSRAWEDHVTVDFEETAFFSWLDPLGIYLGVHAGPDYYNIWYHNYVKMIRVGIAVDPGNKFWVPGMK